MLSRSASPLSNQQRGNKPSASSKVVICSGVPGNSGTVLARKKDQPSFERCNRVSSPLGMDTVRRGATDMTLLGTAVHDLRHPAAALLVYSELLTESFGRSVTKKQSTLIDSVHSVSQYLLQLLDDTLDFARTQSGTVLLRTTPSNIADIAAQSVAMSRPLAARKNMHFTVVQEGEPQRVLVDPVKIRKVFNNLIENAIKYCQPGAHIDIRIWRTKDTVMVSVHDDGPGIEPSDLKTLFNPFQRTLARALSDEPGAGLGLAIAKQIVDLHGGWIRVESKVDQGTTFYVSFSAQARPTSKIS